MANGTNGADTFSVPAGNSDFNGLGGVDTLILNFRLVDATFAWVGNKVIIDTPTSHTVVTGFEIFQFTDGTVNNDDGNRLIDDLFYNARHHDIWNAQVDAEFHYNNIGWHERRDPSAFFSTQIYLTTNPDVAAAGVNPLEHFATIGWTENRDPSLNFDLQKYLQAYPDVAAARINPFFHFLAVGAGEGREPFMPSPLPAANGFDYVFYLQTYPDVAAAGVDPFFHFQNTGWKEGRNPNEYFDTLGYLTSNPDVAAANINPLDHYHTHGWKEGRNPSPFFDTALYLQNNPDVAAAQIDPLHHFLQFGTGEGRIASVSPFFDRDNTANSALEGAANGAQTGVSASWGGWISPVLTYTLIGDTSGGGFAVNASTGVITVADGTKLDFETSGPSHEFVVTVQADNSGQTVTQMFTITVANAPPTAITDANVANETVNEGAAVNTLVGIDADSFDPNGPAVTWSIASDSSGGGFKIDVNGVVSVADASKIDHESAPGIGHSYTVVVQASDGSGGTTTRPFLILVNNVNPTAPVDTSGGAGGSVVEGAAVDTLVGIDADASDINGPAVTWSIVNDPSNGGFKIDAVTGVVSVADPSKVDYESAPGAGNSYDITVRASDGEGGFSDSVFTIGVTNVDPDPPSNADAGQPGGPTVAEGAAVDATVGITAVSSDPGGTPVLWSIVADDSNGGFKIGTDGVVRVADSSKIDFESSGVDRSYDITVRASDGQGGFTDSVFAIGVVNVAPATPVDGDATNDAAGIHGRIEEGGTGAPVGIDANANDPNGPAVTWSILSGTASGGFQIDANTGVVTVLNGALLDYETAPSLGGGLRGHTITVEASDGVGGTSTQTFTIEVTNEAPVAPTDVDPVGNAGPNNGIAAFDALAGTLVGIQAQSAGDPGGGTVTYELAAGSSTFFQIDSNTGEVSVSAAGQGNLVSGTAYDIFVVAEDSTGVPSGTSTATQFKISVQGLAPFAPADTDGADNEVAEDALTGVYTGLQAVSSTVGVTYSLSADSSGGGFSIDIDGKIYIADASLIDYESAPGHAYTVTVVASDGSLTSSTTFSIDVLDVAPALAVDGDASSGTVADAAQGRVAVGAALLSNVGITVASTDVDGGALTYILTDNPGSRFAIDATTGVVTLADNTGLTAGALLTFKAIARSTNGDLATRDSAERTFTVDVVSNQPVVDINGLGGGGNAGINFTNSFIEDSGAVLITDTDAAIADPGFTNLTSATVTLTNAQLGDALTVGNAAGLTVNTVSGGGKITVTLSGNAPFASYETALRSITFNNTSNTPNTIDRVITVVVNDGVNAPSNAATSTISVAANNDAPVLSLTLPTATYQENAAPTTLVTSGTVADPDAPVNFSGGSYTAEITGNASAGDQIVLRAGSGFSASGLTPGSSISFGGNVIGTIHAGTALGSALVTIDFTSMATPAVVNALTTAFAYQNASETPAANTRTVTFTFNDGGNTGGGSQTDVETQTVVVTAVNDAPVNTVPAGTAEVGTSGTFTFNGADTISITDVDGGGGNQQVTLSVTSGTLTLSGIAGLSFTVGSGTADATMTFTGTVTAINNALNGLVFNAPASATTATLTITTDDQGNTGTDPGLTGTGTSEADTDTVQIVVTTPTGQGGPQVDLDANNNNDPGATTGYTTTFTEAASPTPVAVVDTDIAITGAPESAVVTLVNAKAGDVLRVDGGTISGILEYNSGDDVIGWSINTGTPGQITITFVSILGFPSPNDYQDALQQITFANTGDNPDTTDRTLTVVLNDGANNSNTAISTIHVAGVNDAPAVDLDTVAGGTDFATTYQYGNPGALIATGNVALAITDPDNTTVATATVTLTNRQAGDTLAFNGPLPAGITAAIDTTTDPLQIFVTLTGPASHTAFATALQQLVFSNSNTAAFDATARSITVVVNDGAADSPIATTTITVSNEPAPDAVNDNLQAFERGGLNNATAPSAPDPSGNVITGTTATGAGGEVADTDDGGVAALVVTAVGTGSAGTPVASGTVGTALTSTFGYGSLTINADGSYSYSVDNTNAAVQALATPAAALTDLFHYTITDAFGRSDTATITITISGADDFAQAIADTGSLGEDASATLFNVRLNDALDPDSTALNSVALFGSVTAVGNGAANGIGIDATDVTVSLVGNDIQVTLTGSDFQKLAVGDTATITVPYTLTGDTGQTSAAVNLVVTVNGANDLPVANDDSGLMSEDAATTPFTVLTGAGADTLDVDRTAPIASTPGLVTTGTVGVIQDAVTIAKGIDGSDVTVGVNASNQITVALGSDFQKLAVGETATITVGYLLHGDGADADSANLTVTVNGVNDAPVVDLLSTAGLQTTGTTATLTENSLSNPVTVLSQLTLTDVDTANIGGAVVTLTNPQLTDVVTVSGFAGTSGTLASGIDFVITSGTTVTFSNIDSVADYQAALRLVQFNNTSEAPVTTARSFSVEVTDALGAVNAATTATVNVVGVNDAPVNTAPDNLNPMSDTDFAFTGPNTVSIADVDAGSGTVRVTLTTAHGDVSLTLGGASIFTGAQNTHTLGIQGTVAQVNSALSTLVYNSDLGYVGLDSITVLTNDQGNSPAPPLTDSEVIDLGVLPKVWFIDNTPPGSPTGPLGSQGNPFTSIAQFNAATTGLATNEIVYLRSGTYAEDDGINLKNGQTLIGQGEDLTVNNPFGGTLTLENAGATPIIQLNSGAGAANNIGVDLAQNNTVRGLNIVTSLASQSGIDDGNNGAGTSDDAVGTLTISNVDVTGVGKAIDVDEGGALTVSLDKVTSTGSGSQGIDLGGGLTGSFAVTDNTSSVSGATSTAFNLAGGGSLGVTYNGGITQGSNAAMVSVAGGHTGTITFQNGTLSATNGTGLQFDNADGTYNLNGTTTLNGGNAGVDILNGSNGNFNFSSNTSITNPSGVAFNVDGGTGNIDYNGTIAKNSDGRAINMTNKTGGTVSFDGTVSSTSVSDGINLDNNDNAAINFTNTLTLTTSGSTAFNAVNGGTVTATGSGSVINSGNSTALNVANTNIGAADLKFQSISANGAASGIVLNNTGTSASFGGLIVTGNGVNGESTTGGLITNTTGVGVSLTNTRDVSLTNLGISNTGSFGINISSVTNFTYQDAAIINAGNENEENTIQILNLHGTSLIEDVRLDDIQEDGIQIRQDVDTDSNLNTFDTITIRRLDLEDHQAGFGEAGIEIQTNLASTLAVVIDDSDFAINTNAIMGVAMSKSATFTGHQKVTIQNSTFDGSAAFGSGAIQALGSIGSGTTTYLITGNTITNTQFDGIRVNNDGGHTNVTITNNDIDGSTAVGKVNNGEGITLRQDENGSMTVLISGNDMTQITSNQIRIQGSDATIDDNVINVDATITNNTGTVAGSFGAGLLVDVGDGSGIAKNDVRINVTGNNLNGTNTTPFFDFDITLNLNETSGASLRVTQASDAALAAANVATTVSSFSNPPNTITYNAGTPPTPPLPLLAAAGGVESASGTPGDHDLTSPELAVMVTAAIGRWGVAGLTGVQLAQLRGFEFATADLGGSYLGVQDGGRILIDDDAAGYGWFVDTTPFDDAEFGHTVSATQLQTDPSSAPAGHMDLLTLVMHEIGHVLGLDHSHEGSGGDLMSGSLMTGERRLPDASDTAGLSAPEIVGQTIVGGFDAEYYLAHNPDVAAAGVDPLAHFNTHGWHEGRDPNAYFDTEGYLAHYTDVAAAGVNPLQHYAEYGWREGRDPSTHFDTQKYLAANPDVAAANVSPLEHFLQYGIREGRAAVNDGLWG